jgi:hypothetical protein
MSTAEARSGSRSRSTRNILTVSLGLIVLLFVIALAFGFSKTSQTGADDVNAGNAGRSELIVFRTFRSPRLSSAWRSACSLLWRARR